MTMVRNTRQRQAVVQALRETHTHPDAAWIHGQVRATLPSISLGTVYRTLDALVRDGVVMTIERAGQATRYDYKHEGHGHHHVVCRTCGAIYDIPAEAVPMPASGLPQGFQVQDVRLEYHGVCTDCTRAEKRG
ncbi:Fur family transcriptional regulator [Deinococcus aquiradiocola]|uniref:Transcriptional repressor n=1 Tax=Deinococcus aquiradiocola TaxID=393059 RepID=A0A917PNU3_9DEIO|nr:transcriptional repressor [Deinococcus aquiradiocola]GGJ86389.1 transcriptional repressor [Deinococcus aquiradiocola]